MNRYCFPIFALFSICLNLVAMTSPPQAQAQAPRATRYHTVGMTPCCCRASRFHGIHNAQFCQCLAAGNPCHCPAGNTDSGNNGGNESGSNSGFISIGAGRSNPNGTAGSQSLADQEEAYEKSHPLTKLAEPPCFAPPGPATDHWVAKNIKISTEWRTETNFQPNRVAQSARAEFQAQATSVGNAVGEVARDQAVNAIDYCSKFMINFSAEAGNNWNRIRNEIFLPIAILLLLPGAVLTQVKAVISAGSPIVGNTGPLEGLQRSVVAIFLIPGSYLVVNYGIDFSNSITHTIADEYHRLFGSDMYEDAICAEIRAFSPRHQAENDSSLKIPPFNTTPMNNGIFSKIESDWGKLLDPSVNLNLAPKNRDDGAANANTIAKRLMLNTTNAGLDTTWAILCAFQMAFMYYLFFVGPIMAALWVWPTKLLREAFPLWVEGVITLCFWSLFWNTVILLMACFKGCDDTGIIMMTALNFLASAAVKYAFDFAGLVKSAGQKAADAAEKEMNSGGQNTQAGNSGMSAGNGNQASPSPMAGSSAPSPEMLSLATRSPAPRPPAIPSERSSGATSASVRPYNFTPDENMSNDQMARLMPLTLPPLASLRPKTMIMSDGDILFLRGKNGAENYERLTVPNAKSGDHVPQFKFGRDGRVYVYDAHRCDYKIETAAVDGRDLDRYKVNGSIFQRFDENMGSYVDFDPFSEKMMPPPLAVASGTEIEAFLRHMRANVDARATRLPPLA
ncbi:MAG: hypothetical protein K2Y39_23690 [Candidatus Obscuribacterales bacterium]|nr:hypothetical protein [Candidatus Obscuribacterales bacterium]